ncbi:MAG: hypothetical protein ACM4D3_24875 [Candidatus Sericytochromatia bacterium]
MRALMASIAVLAMVAGCSSPSQAPKPYGAQTASIGESIPLLGWNISIANLRWEHGHVLVDVDAAPSGQGKAHAKAEDIRFGLYGALAHPVEADGLGSCNQVASLAITPLSAPNPDRLTGTVCLGPLENQSEVRGVYAYSPRDRIPNTTAAYPVAFPVGILPTNRNDTGITVKSTSAEAWRADGTMLTSASLGDPVVFSGSGYMLLGLEISAIKQQYDDESAQRGGPLMVVVTPTLPAGQGLSHACATYGSSVLVLPDAKLDSVRVDASLCTQGEVNQAVLYATLSVIGTHAAVWTSRD